MHKSTNTIALSERVILLIPWMCVLLIGMLAIFCFGVRLNAKNFLEKVHDQTLAVNLDLSELCSHYFDQLRFIKQEIEEIGLDEKQLASFFTSNKIVMLDKANIATILVTDKNFNIIYADKFPHSEYSTLTISDRDYQRQIQDFPKQIIIGDSVIGILTKKLAIPIAIGIGMQDNVHNNFIGALIFSIPLENLSQTFTERYLKQVNFVDDSIIKVEANTYEYLADHYLMIFVNKILFNLEQVYQVVLDQKFGNTTIVLNYDIPLIRRNFFIDYFLLYSTVLMLVLFIMWILFNYYVLKPLLPIISSKNNLLIPGKNIFAKIREINTIYHLLQEKSLESKQYNEKFIAASVCLNFITNQINNKAEMLKEDIEDILLVNPVYDQLQSWYQDTLRNVYQVSLNNSEETTEIMKIMTYAIQEITHTTKELVDITQMLTCELNIGSDLVTVENNTNYQEFSGSFFKNLLMQSLHNAILYTRDCGNIIQVVLTQNELIYSINFVCVLYNSNTQDQKLNLMRCRAWALVNCASINVHYTRNIMALSFQIHKILF